MSNEAEQSHREHTGKQAMIALSKKKRNQHYFSQGLYVQEKEEFAVLLLCDESANWS